MNAYHQPSLFDAPPRPVAGDRVTTPSATDLPFDMSHRLLLAGWHWLRAERRDGVWRHQVANLANRSEKRTATVAELRALIAPIEAQRLTEQAQRLGFHVRPVDGDCLLLWRDNENPDNLLPLGFDDVYWFLDGLAVEEQPR